VGILATYMPLNMDTFHLSLSTKIFNGTIFKRLSSFYFVNNFKCPTSGNSNIYATMFSMNNTGTPYTNDFITSVLDRTIPWINSLIRGQMGVSSRLRRTPTPTCFAKATSLPTIHLCSLSILIKVTFFIGNGHYVLLSPVSFVQGYI